MVQQRCWTVLAGRRDPRLTIRQHHSPLSDGCKGLGFCLSQTLNLLHWVRPDPSRRHRFIRSRESRNTVTTGPVGRGGLVGARTRLQSQQHFSDSTRFSGSLDTAPSSTLHVRGHLAPQNWAHQQCRSSRPARTARQYPMLDARYI